MTRRARGGTSTSRDTRKYPILDRENGGDGASAEKAEDVNEKRRARKKDR
jgi:hypothetical protein